MSNASKEKPTHHYGRGGAGNVIPRNEMPRTPLPTAEKMTTPTLKSKMYTTGRGGTGNMAKNDFGDEARTAQDVDVPGITLPEGSHHTGRGGAANRYTPTELEAMEAKNNNQKVRSSSFQRSKEGLKELRDKAKAMVGKGKDNDEEAAS